MLEGSHSEGLNKLKDPQTLSLKRSHKVQQIHKLQSLVPVTDLY